MCDRFYRVDHGDGSLLQPYYAQTAIITPEQAPLDTLPEYRSAAVYSTGRTGVYMRMPRNRNRNELWRHEPRRRGADCTSVFFTLPEEQWRKAVYRGEYVFSMHAVMYVSNLGRCAVFCLVNNMMQQKSIFLSNGNPYIHFNHIHTDKFPNKMNLGKVIFETFTGQMILRKALKFRDGNKQNIRLENLY